ncbi:EF-P lysine aminoacylase EpmA [Patescibacteria group bacterium]|jgi:lysyl-tRNA synthetase class 2|nr:EF-P lysine aminoacylase EpmA [Patescibacteria group bacterium]
MNLEQIRARSRVVQLVRRYFDEQGFLELQTPRLVGLPGQEPYLEPMWSKVEEADGTPHRGALITSPEYAMKRMLAAGFEKIYDLGPCFRNDEPWDGTHDPEFLMVEWYEKGIGLSELMERTEAMVKWVAGQYGKPFSETAFRRLSVRDAMKQYANVELDSLIGDREAVAEACREHHQTVNEADTWDDLFFKIFLSEVEPKLGEVPTFLHTYPVSMAALAKKDPSDPRYALRTELYIGSLELANGFVELTDATEQRKRFEEEQELRRSLGKETWPIDERFLEALPKMGEASGIAFGVDRLAMLLTGAKSLSELMPIPVRERF